METVEIKEGKPGEKTGGEKDFNKIAEQIYEIYMERKNKRSVYDRTCKEIDRQLRMEPDISHKLDSEGRPDRNKAWMPEVELPLQAQTLEVLTAEARGLQFSG